MKTLKLFIFFTVIAAVIILYDYISTDSGGRYYSETTAEKPAPPALGINDEPAPNSRLLMSISFREPEPNIIRAEIIDNFSTRELKYNNKGVCVLLYHCIDFSKSNGLKIPPLQFEKQMKYLRDNGYTALTLDQLYEFMKNNQPIPKKSLVITFDDGYADNYTYAYPILKEYNMPATIFVITNNIDRNTGYMTSAQLKELQYNGIDIQSHTLNHEQLNTLSYQKQLRILCKSKEALESILDKDVNYIAYPCAEYNEDTLTAAREAGYKMGFVTGGNVARKSNGIYTLRRFRVVSQDGMDVFAGRLMSR